MKDYPKRPGSPFRGGSTPSGRTVTVSTFCHQLAAGERPEIHHDIDLQLIHAQDVADIILDILLSGRAGEVRATGRSVTVTQLLARLSSIASCYRDHRIPDLTDPLDLSLFNTFRSYLYPQHYPVGLHPHVDSRGRLLEMVRCCHSGGQCFFSTTAEGVTRGNHFHRRKFERFVVLQGTAHIEVRRLFTSDVSQFAVDGAHPSYVDIPTLHTHNIKNAGSGEMVALFWANEIFDPAAPDTFGETV